MYDAGTIQDDIIDTLAYTMPYPYKFEFNQYANQHNANAQPNNAQRDISILETPLFDSEVTQPGLEHLVQTAKSQQEPTAQETNPTMLPFNSYSFEPTDLDQNKNANGIKLNDKTKDIKFTSLADKFIGFGVHLLDTENCDRSDVPYLNTFVKSCQVGDKRKRPVKGVSCGCMEIGLPKCGPPSKCRNMLCTKCPRRHRPGRCRSREPCGCEERGLERCGARSKCKGVLCKECGGCHRIDRKCKTLPKAPIGNVLVHLFTNDRSAQGSTEKDVQNTLLDQNN
mmetsp:Transcript_19129/g.31357  ORF Transcript_19129/g.31357 Transcript_19129/m.31357 type:complete len:282 (+) Transcript_19129:175-1020(+)|eukprot:CAMPEP_0203749110 /NCGR_PEP_ID=MMETSP0098-20131031/3786_1 /ASSEMBLY_ACC=CAM_ASM_000208 /TAXON_ID=96639 /ORGANISM=" , Strain NY0313808BC1" /LENGTH=281 /DNA_ID=CAMNT_0050638071 /DNA_START=153 /DNA_END=998 /DNA_ORIENTATION=+